MERLSFYSILPAEVRYHKKLTLGCKILYSEITALANKRGYCYASNEYFSEAFGVSGRMIRNWITGLVNENFIRVEITEGKKRKINLPGNVFPRGNKLPAHSSNSTLKSSSSLNEEKKEEKRKLVQKNKELIESTVDQVIQYLNTKAGKEFSIKTEAHRRLIRARIREGFEFKDFTKIIDTKTAKWKGVKTDRGDMGDYLRPETLFCAKHFEAYLSESPPKAGEKISEIDYTQIDGIR